MKDIKGLAEQKKKKKIFLQKLLGFDPKKTGEVSFEDFNKASNEANVIVDEDDFDHLK